MKKTFVKRYDNFWGKFLQLGKKINDQKQNFEKTENANTLEESTKLTQLKTMEIEEYQIHLKNRCIICLSQFKNNQIVYHTNCHIDLWYHDECFDIYLNNEFGCPICRLPFNNLNSSEPKILEELN